MAGYQRLSDTEFQPNQDEVRIILLGKTGAGKSATGNTILGGDMFQSESSFNTITQRGSKCSVEREGRKICVIDTPGTFGSMPKEELIKQIKECVDLSLPGPHAFLLVIRFGRFTEEEKDAVKWIQDNFGKDALLYTIVVFTHVDQLKGRPLDQCINENKDILKLIDSCGGRYHALNNEQMSDRVQVTELLQKIINMVQSNGGKFYTNEMFKKAMFLQKVKSAAIGTGVAIGAVGALAGGVTLAVTEAVILPAVALAGGVVVGVVSGGKLAYDKIKKK